MNKEQFLEQFFKRENITKYTTSYILFYQVSLGNYVFETLHDIEETKQKLLELNLALEPNSVIIDIFLIALNSLEEEDILKSFETSVKRKALLHSLEDFVNKDHELLGKQRYKNFKQEQILNDTLFNSNMKMQFLQEYPVLYKDYEKVITKEYADQVKEILTSNFMSRS